VATGTYTAGGSFSGTAASSQAQSASATGTYTPAAVTGSAASAQAQTTAGTGTYTAVGVSGTATSAQAQRSAASGSTVLGSAVWPTPAQVQIGISYGPTGAEYLGTLVATASQVVSAVTMQINTTSMQVDDSTVLLLVQPTAAVTVSTLSATSVADNTLVSLY
jgi:hypothetical protein